MAEVQTTTIPDQPRKPNPSADPAVVPDVASLTLLAGTEITSPPQDVDPATLTPVAALTILCRSVQSLVDLTGDVPPTPPISRPATPSLRELREGQNPRLDVRPATPASSIPPDDLNGPYFSRIPIGSPEAHASEPSFSKMYAAEPLRVQHEAIARKFFSKKPPPISVEAYLLRMHRYCPMSTAVYLAAAAYIYRVAIEDRTVPVTLRTVHRLLLAALRVAMKGLEDLSYPHQRFAGVGGVADRELAKLEIALCYLLDFDVQVDNRLLREKVAALQKMAECGRAPPRLNLPPRVDHRRRISTQLS
ncbi:hypothetical protein FH972_023878 [Carpinus fangiana]|uniref:Cyclin n=1 Tax=Carpinus fangiana TaxID=176857 RepID=A0A5N6KWG0_9ROSI|nr:hypothetical protein FH972_023878 [Carpinus fangiana]